MTKPPAPIPPSEPDLNSVLGFEIDSMETGHAVGHFEVKDRVRQPFGIVHGGSYAAIAETLASACTYFTVGGEGKIVMGMSNNTTFLRPVLSGTVSADAVAIQQGATTWVWDVTMRDDENRVCAVSRVTIAVRPQRV